MRFDEIPADEQEEDTEEDTDDDNVGAGVSH